MFQHLELLEDERCRSHNQRIEHREVTEDLLNEWGMSHTLKEVCAALDAVGIPNTPVNSVREVAEDSHFAEYRSMFPQYVQPELGEVRVANLPLRFPEREGVLLELAPAFGEQTEEILKELLRMEERELRELRRNGIVVSK